MDIALMFDLGSAQTPLFGTMHGVEFEEVPEGKLAKLEPKA